MTREEIHREYDGKWVFLINCKLSELHSVAGGEVAVASRSKDEFFREMERYKHEKSLTFIFRAGKLPEGTGVLL
jgi:hypothetical protein